MGIFQCGWGSPYYYGNRHGDRTYVTVMSNTPEQVENEKIEELEKTEPELANLKKSNKAKSAAVEAFLKKEIATTYQSKTRKKKAKRK